MKKILMGVFISIFLFACNNEKKDDATVATTTTSNDKKPDSELLDMSIADPITKGLEAFSKGDIDGMTADFDDNMRLLWSGGDSLVGKQAVKDYYTGRWKLIESLSFSNQIYLPIQVNKSQTQYDPPGKWVLSWVMADVKYKNGKKINFWVHRSYHLNEAGKVDLIAEYIDRHLLMEATKGMQ